MYDDKDTFSKCTPYGECLLNKQKVDIACCITIFNESEDAILTSLASLSHSIDNFQKKQKEPKKVTIVLITDGREHVALSTIHLFRKLGLMNESAIYSESGEFSTVDSFKHEQMMALTDSTLASQSIDPRWLAIYNTSLMSHHSDSKDQNISHQTSYSLMLFIKEKNQGKLNSHWWFFNHFCKQLNPEYCIQIDAGTAPNQNTLNALYTRVASNPRLGALASRIQVPAPNHFGRLLHVWQYGDFLVQKIMDWPAEVKSGFLTVIPGQFCMFRWAAIANDSDTSEANHASVLTRYFRGLNNLSCFEANMFLAEDRVLGFELISQKGSNFVIGYAPEAVSTTDICETLPELIRQRRRWINSSFACNLNTIANIFSYLRNSGANLSNKAHTTLAIPWLIMNGLVQWFFPAMLILLCAFLTSTASKKFPVNTLSTFIETWLLPLFIASLGIQVFVYMAKPTSEYLLKNFTFTVATFQIIVLTACALNFIFKVGDMSLIALPLILLVSIYGISLAISMRFLMTSIKYLWSYPFVTPFVTLAFTIYSVCNCHDVSWGTKGLNKIVKVKLKFSKSTLKNELKLFIDECFRPTVFLMWSGSNFMLCLVYFLSETAEKKIILDSIFLFLLCYLLFKSLSGMLTFLMIRLKNL